MPTDTQQRVYDLLCRVPINGLAAVKQLFWTELNYDRVHERLSTRDWPERAQAALHEPPILLAQHPSQFGTFDVLYMPLAAEARGRAFLSLTAERLVVDRLLHDHPYALFLFSDPKERHWHLVNVKLAQVQGTSQVPRTSGRRLFRRIAVGPYERLRTAAERVAMLDLASLSPDLSGLSPLAVQQRHDEAFDVEAVTREFFGRFARLYYRVRDEVAAAPGLAGEADDLAQMLLDRLLFLCFIQKKGWLDGNPDYLYHRFCREHAGRPEETSYYGQVIYPLFLALSDRETNRGLAGTLGAVPFLNGGLFDLPLHSSGREAGQARMPVSNATFDALFGDLFEHYNFTVSEDSPLDQEVAIDPEMLGKVFESLVLEREHDPEVDLRKATGSYYTPRPVVAYMCREALAEYLSGASGMDRDLVARLLDLPPPDRLADEERAWLRGAFSPVEARGLKALLLDVRACDPAVGSGAFLMGLLQAIAWAAALLDWLAEGEEALAQRNYAYDLKKQIVEGCLYGVDIQAQAVQICELRLWLSLVVEYELPEGAPLAEALGEVPALPNLAYKVRQGDSLLERLFGQALSLDEMARDREARELVEDLQNEKRAYFELAEAAEKRRRELRILELQTVLAEKLVAAKRARLAGYQPSFFGDETAAERRAREAYEARARALDELEARVDEARKRLAQLRRQGDERGLSADDLRADALRRLLLGDAEHPTFLWRVDFAEVYQDKGGFDLMIANPPYVRQERIAHLKADLQAAYSDVYHGVADLYVYFYAQGLRQLRDGGALVYISSNKFMRAGYGQTLRRLLGQTVTLRTAIDFGDLPVFEATTYPMVLAMRKAPPPKGHAVQALTVDDMAAVGRLPEAVREGAWAQPQETLRAEGWTLVPPGVMALVDRLRHSGMPLSEYIDGGFYRGVTTGLNQAFVINQHTYKQLVTADPSSAQIIKPWLRGRDVKRWRVDWAGHYLIWTYQGVAIKRYPAILEYLTSFKDRLAKRWEPSRGQCEWYELRPCDYYSEFERHKIVYPDIAKRPEFAYDTTAAYGGNTIYILPTEELYLLGILNSKVVAFFYAQISSSIQSDYVRFIATYMQQVPIPRPTPDQHAAVESLVRKLLDARGQGPQAAEWERALNEVVYEVYGLTEQEIRIVEESV